MSRLPNPKVLGLSQPQHKVLRTLTDPMNPTDIATVTGLPRTTVHYLLTELLARGLVKRRKFGRRYTYVLVDPQVLSGLAEEVKQLAPLPQAILRLSEAQAVAAHKGVSAIVSLQTEQLSLQPRQGRVKVIQPTKSILAMFGKATVDEIIAVNHAISSSAVILDAVLEEGAYATYESYWKVDPEGFGRLNATFLGRTTDYVEVPMGHISFTSELWLYRQTVVVIDWPNQQALSITDPELRGLLEALYETLKFQGRKVDHAARIAGLE